MTRRDRLAELAAERWSEASTGDRDQAAASTVSDRLSPLATTVKYALLHSDGLTVRLLARMLCEKQPDIGRALKELASLGLAEHARDGCGGTWHAVEPPIPGRRRVHVGRALRSPRR